MALHPQIFLLFTLVLALCGKPAADMPFGFVYIQKPPHLPVQCGVYPRQALGKILMYSRFAYAELLCGGADGGLVIYDVRGKVADPFLNICTHMHHSQLLVVEYMRGQSGICETERGWSAKA